MGFWAELQRRSVIRVGAAYLIAAWLVLQIVNNVVGPLSLPGWTASLVVVLLGVGFPIALVIAWAFELTPAGVKRSEPAADDAAPAKLAVPTSRCWSRSSRSSACRWSSSLDRSRRGQWSTERRTGSRSPSCRSSTCRRKAIRNTSQTGSARSS